MSTWYICTKPEVFVGGALRIASRNKELSERIALALSWRRISACRWTRSAGAAAFHCSASFFQLRVVAIV